MMEHSKTSFLNELIEMVLHNVIYYVPSETIVDGILAQIESDLPDNFFDELNLFDIDKGIFEISNEDALEINQRLLDKRIKLEENIFKLEAEKKQLEPVTFEIIIQKYYDQLIFVLYIAEWLITNLKKYQEDKLNLSLIGSFNLQYLYLKNHLKDIIAYFGNYFDTEREYNFSSETLVMEYLPDLIARLNQIENNRIISISDKTSFEIEPITKTNWNLDKPTSKKRVKKKRPVISNEEIEKMILESVFNIKINE